MNSIFRYTREAIRFVKSQTAISYHCNNIEQDARLIFGKDRAANIRAVIAKWIRKIQVKQKPFVAGPKQIGCCPICGRKSAIAGGYCSDWCKGKWNEKVQEKDHYGRLHWQSLGNGGFMAKHHQT